MLNAQCSNAHAYAFFSLTTFDFSSWKQKLPFRGGDGGVCLGGKPEVPACLPLITNDKELNGGKMGEMNETGGLVMEDMIRNGDGDGD